MDEDLDLLIENKIKQIKKHGENRIAIYTEAGAVVIFTATCSHEPRLDFIGIEFPIDTTKPCE